MVIIFIKRYYLTDYQMINKEEKIKLIKDIAKKNNISPYTIGSETDISISSAVKIFSGEQKNPRPKTINIILEYLSRVTEDNKLEIATKKYTEELDKIDIDKIVVYLINNEEKFKKSKTYNLFKKALITEEAERIVKNQINSTIKDNLEPNNH
jgi:transcriptional regulator with XRE-family HTH domain